MKRCDLNEFFRRARQAGLLQDGSSTEIEGSAASYAEEISIHLQLSEEERFRLLSLEYSLDYLPLSLVEKMSIPKEFRSDDSLAVFRRDGFAPVEKDGRGRVLVAVVYPFASDVEMIIADQINGSFEMVLCTDRNLGDILKSSVDVGEGTEFESDDSFFIGSDSEEDAFPGLYGESAADVLWDGAKGRDSEGGSAESRSMNGFVEDLSLPDMLQMIANAQKSASIVIHSEQYGDIYFFFEKGDLIHCITEYGAGEEAFYKIVDIANGPFEIQTGPVEVEATITKSIQGLLMEGFRRKDEEQRED